MKQFMITGANFINKGAQAMLFVTVDELRRRYPDCRIYFATSERISKDDYWFDTIKYTRGVKKVSLGGINAFKELMISIVKDFVKIIIRYPKCRGGYFKLKPILKQLDLIIDISGFALGDKWSKNAQENYLDNIRIAKKYGIKMVLMPQSFGPFNYNSDMQVLHEEIKELMQYPYAVYAREEQGSDLLEGMYELNNVRRSSDIVLQNKGIDNSRVFKQKPVLNIPNGISHDSVAIIPNARCLEHGRQDDILFLYRKIVDLLLKNSREVYLLRHSREDLPICQMIKGMFANSDSVHLIENDFSCIEFDEVVKKFQLSIVSRFHGAVHSYKNCVPCIILGWAVKYKELAACMNQSEFVFDITIDGLDIDKILQYITKMLGGYETEKAKIRESLSKVQQSNCFDVLEEIFNE